MGYWDGKRVLVTGGASFIGSHLVDKLVSLNATVCVADDLSSGKLENLHNSLNSINFQKGDLRDRTFAKRVIEGNEVVFHLAACHGGRGFIDTHPADCASNLVLDGIVFDEAWRAKVDQVCYASSACVYPIYHQKNPLQERQFILKKSGLILLRKGVLLPMENTDGQSSWEK